MKHAMNIVDDAGREQYAAAGFLRLENAVPEQEIERVLAIVQRLFAQRAGQSRGDFLDLAGDDSDAERAVLPQILMPVKYAPELAEGTLRPCAERIARALLGEGLQYEGEHVIAKPPFGPATPLHQDEAFWSETVDYTSLSIWFPLHPVSARNGSICFVPGSHTRGVLPHHSVDNDVTKNGIEIDGAGTFAPVPMELPPGGATVHHCRTIHGALANSTGETRYAYIFGFGLPAVPAADRRNHYWLHEKRLLRAERARTEQFELTKMRPEF